jgi:hypothetical protein
MSDKTLFNQDLIVNKLTVNNSIDANVSGYVPQATIITAGGIQNATLATNELTLTNATAPDVTLTNANGTVYTPNSVNVNGTITTNSSVAIGNTLILKNSPTSPNDVVLSCPQNDVLNIAGSTITTNVSLLSSTGNVNLTAPSGNTLQVGGNVQATGAVTSANLTLVSGVNSTTLTQSSTANNTLVVSGDLQVGNSITLPNNDFAFISSPTFSGGIVSALLTPPTSGAWYCLQNSTTAITLPPFYFNPPTSVYNCPYFFTFNTSNNVALILASYTLVQSNFQVTMTLNIANLENGGGNITSIGVLAINPSV